LVKFGLNKPKHGMPFLIFKEYKTDFKDITKDMGQGLPESLRPAAELIAQWKSGRKTFELKTSGSTGKPKTIKLQRDKIIYSAKLTAETFNLSAGDTLLCCLGLHYIAGFMMVMRAVVNNCDLIIEEPASNPLKDIDKDQELDFASFIPLQMETMLDDNRAVDIMNGMKAILLGGSPVSETLEEKLQVIKAPIYHTYSMTETYTHVATTLSGVKISTDTRGCLVINSYLTDNENLVTNDLAEIHKDGSFTWIGRYDNVINSGGIKIQLEKIEQVCGEVFKYLEIPSHFFAYGLPDEKLGEKLVLVVEGEAWGVSMTNEVNDQLSALLGKYETPKEILFVKEILKTRTGKVDRMNSIKHIFSESRLKNY
jgi:O-succinylbenzoic acid--CoA ligase